ncbi:MAG: exodeoxyribonuclease I [Candidatus Saccharimonas sp.]|jgi:exodeoxyribonuclease I
MAQTFFFYDLETSGLNAREDRIMQFAGRRTSMDLTPIGEPYNMLVALSDDTLPNPDALMVTGITPQKTVDEGYSEVQFARILNDEIFTPDTIVVGFNNIRFDDEFIRHLLWRNFYDPYEWCWKDGRSRWDMLDVVRMTRALRPEGISWPLDDAGEPTNRLELITRENGIAHKNAHDAMSDVDALIDVTKLIRDKQPQLFEYLLKMRDKKEVVKLVNVDDKKPFVYSSGRYDKEFAKTTAAFPLSAGRNGNVVVYDLRYDPTPFIDLSESELAHKVYASWQERQAEDFVKLPAKELQPNRCPAVAPLGVLAHGGGWAKISLDAETIAKHQKILLAHPEFAEKLRTIFENKPEFTRSPDPEAQLYDGFLNDRDRLRAEAVRNASERELDDFHPNFADERLPGLLLHYKARNFPKTLSGDEREMWQTWRAARIQTQLPKYMAALQRFAASALDPGKEFIVQELQLWAESILPEPD